MRVTSARASGWSCLDDPRVLFTAERTLLARLRTAIALPDFGFVVERRGRFLHRFGNHPLHARGVLCKSRTSRIQLAD